MNLKKWLLLSAATLSLLSCIKEDEDVAEVPATAQEVGQALVEAWGSADPLTMAPGEHIATDTWRKVDNSVEPFYVLQEGVTVKSKTEQTDHFVYQFLHRTRVEQQGVMGPESTQETDPITVEKPTPAQAAAAELKSLGKLTGSLASETPKMSLGFAHVYNMLFACVDSPERQELCSKELGLDSCDVKCSNLKVAEAVVPVPSAIKDQPNCGGFANCTYREKTVTFDWVIAFKKGASLETQKVNYKIVTSPDLPFLARLTMLCNRMLVSVQTTQALVTTCREQRNYVPAPVH